MHVWKSVFICIVCFIFEELYWSFHRHPHHHYIKIFVVCIIVWRFYYTQGSTAVSRQLPFLEALLDLVGISGSDDLNNSAECTPHEK